MREFQGFFDENVVGEELFGDMPVHRLVRACDICVCVSNGAAWRLEA